MRKGLTKKNENLVGQQRNVVVPYGTLFSLFIIDIVGYSGIRRAHTFKVVVVLHSIKDCFINSYFLVYNILALSNTSVSFVDKTVTTVCKNVTIEIYDNDQRARPIKILHQNQTE